MRAAIIYLTPFIYLTPLCLMMGCGTQTVVREPVEVRIPVAVPCKIEAPARPAMPTAALPAGASRATWLQAALVERENLLGYVPQLEAAIVGCK